MNSSAWPPLDLATAARLHSWDWLFELRRRLNVVAEIVDEQGAPALPASSAATPGRLLARPDNPTLRSAITKAIQLKLPQSVPVDQYVVSCFSLAPVRAARGALLLARDQPSGVDGFERTRQELDMIGSWLGPVIEAQLASLPVNDSDTVQRVSSLHRLLRDAVASGSERDVVNVFADAVAVWDDIEVRGYLEDVAGHFVLSVSLVGSDATEAPTVLDDDTVRDAATPTLLSATDAERFGFHATRDLFIARLDGTTGVPWVVALSGAIAPDLEPRLALYVELLRQALQNTARISSTRMEWRILQPLLVASDKVEEAARAAFDELRAEVGGADAMLVVTTSNGHHVLSVGDGDLFSAARTSGEPSQIVSRATLLDRYTMAIAMRRPSGRAFTRREQQILDRAAAIFVSWLSGALQRTVSHRDRRDALHRFDEVVESVAEQTVRHGSPAAVVVIAVADAVFRPGLLDRWVGEIKGLLRASDLTGILTEREIGVLLLDADAGDAAAVVTRVCRHLKSDVDVAELPGTFIGLASREAGAAAGESILDAARDYLHHACAGD